MKAPAKPVSPPSAEAIQHEFIVGSAIAPDVFEANVAIVDDLEIDPVTNEVLSAPIDDALGLRYTRFTWQAKPNRRAALFLAEDGSCWQAKVFGVKAKDKSGQYLAPKGIGDVPYLPTVPRRVVEAIAQKHNLTPPSVGESFWEWFKQHKQIPLIITEGGKKALAAIPQEQAALSLYGCLCGVSSNPFGVKPSLLPYVEGREVIIAFDRDSKPKAARSVIKGTNRLAKAIALAGGKPKVALWDLELGKGLDDLIASSPEAFREAIEQAIPWLIWKLNLDNSLKQFQDLVRIHERYLPDNLPVPETAQIIAIKSPKNTGKTEWLAKKVEAATQEGKKCYVVVHRIQLAKELCHRFGIDHVEEIKNTETKGVLGYGLCIDSLRPDSQARFTPERAEEAVLIFDEVDQVIWHLLGGGTCENKRVSILETLAAAVQTALDTGGKIYLASADLTPKEIHYFRSLANDPKLFIVENTFNPNKGKRKAYLYRSEADLIESAKNALKRGEKIILHLSAQKAKSRWGTLNVEEQIKREFPELSILRIDRHSVANPEHPACGCMGNLNAIIPCYDVVICSPTVETGVSIDVDHFDSVWAIANGIQTVNAVCQTLERVRTDVERHIYIAKSSRKRIGNGETYSQGLLRSQDKNFQLNLGQLSQADLLAKFNQSCPQNLQTWVAIAAELNLGFIHYREMILHKLRVEGYELVKVLEEVATEETRNLAKAIQEEVYDRTCEQIAAQKNPSDSRLDELKEKKNKTDAECLEERKGILCRRYLTEEITPERVKEDDNGLYGRLQIYYYLNQGRAFLAGRDNAKVESISQEGKAFAPDVNRVMLAPKVKAFELLLEPLLDPDEIHTNDSLMGWFQETVLPCAQDIKTYLGERIHKDKDTPVGVAQRLLRRANLKLVCVGRDKQRKYKLDLEGSITPYVDILERWLARDLARSTPPINVEDQRGVDLNQEETSTLRGDKEVEANLQDLATWLKSCTSFEGFANLLELKPLKGNLPLVEKTLRYVEEGARSLIATWLSRWRAEASTA